MKKKVGLWIDDKKAVIFSLTNEGAAIKRISSEADNSIRSSGDIQKGAAVENLNKHSPGHQNDYYDEVFSQIRDAESILIFGPGEAKVELKNRLEKVKLHGNIVGMETADKMTDNQIVTKVRQHFLH
jgi:stalled ribosome rescue protein Dom34